jgi:hypothetical protein
MVSALLTIFVSTLLIITALFLFNFWVNTIVGVIISLFSYVTFLFTNRIYINKGTLTRVRYIQSIFPIKENLTKEQYNIIISDFEYIFGNNKNNVEYKNALAILFKKLKASNLSSQLSQLKNPYKPLI